MGETPFREQTMKERHVEMGLRLEACAWAEGQISQLQSQLSAALQRAKEAEERGFQVLESQGVPRDRAKTVANGIMVFDQRMRREVQDLEAQNSRLKEALKEFGTHNLSCESIQEYGTYHDPQSCTCGYEKALADAGKG